MEAELQYEILKWLAEATGTDEYGQELLDRGMPGEETGRRYDEHVREKYVNLERRATHDRR